jgi:fumarylacetoacetate (FAA) hydrolase
MKLATLKAGGRDGTLIVVDRALRRALAVPEHARSLQQLLDDWRELAPRLEDVSRALNEGRIEGMPLDCSALAAPLPRAYQWLDGSAYLTHVERVRRARGAEMPPRFRTDPLMYQGSSDGFLGPCDPITGLDEQHGVDFEAELAIITDDVPAGVDTTEAAKRIRLLLLVNDISLRNLIPGELAKGLGFLQSKPASALSPVAVTPDELGPSWDGTRINLPLVTHLNGRLFGKPDAGRDLQFDFAELIRHAARTRRLAAGTIIGSGTVSNVDRAVGCSCILEQRVLESLDGGQVATPFLRPGDRVRIEMMDAQGQSIFGAIDQEFQA